MSLHQYNTEHSYSHLSYCNTQVLKNEEDILTNILT